MQLITTFIYCPPFPFLFPLLPTLSPLNTEVPKPSSAKVWAADPTVASVPFSLVHPQPWQNKP